MIEEERALEAARLAELREREACGYDGESPYFALKNQPFTLEEIKTLKKLAATKMREQQDD